MKLIVFAQYAKLVSFIRAKGDGDDYGIIHDMDAKRKIPYVAMNWVKLAGEFVALSAATAFAAAARAGEVFERAAGKVTCAR